MPDKITSTSNVRIKNMIRLRERKHRDKSGLTIIEGEREIQRAMDSGVEILEVYYCGKITQQTRKLIQKAIEKSGGLFVETAQKVFEKISYGERQSGILCAARIQGKSIKGLSLKAPALFLVLESVQKPGNLGAILRTCDTIGIDGVLITEAATDLNNPNTIRSSLGAVFSVDTVVCSNQQALDFLKENKIGIAASSPDAEKSYTQADLSESLALVMGSEDTGLSPFWLQNADLTVSIPMKGSVDSLNVSTSTAVILYEIIRQRSS